MQSPKPPAPADLSTTEMELKFLVDAPTFQALQHARLLSGTAPLALQAIRSIYFDTVDADLWQHHQTILRLRTQGETHILTVKSAATDATNPFARSEIEVACPSADLDLTCLAPPVLAEIQQIIGDKPLLPRFETDIQRKVARVVAQGSDIEVAFDSGHIVHGGAREPIQEIELELKSGDAVDLFGLGLALTEIAPVRLHMQSKAARGRQLSAGTPARAVRAHTALAAADAVDDVIALTLATALRQFVDNWPAFATDDAPEAVHQMRVAMRRLRAALALFHRSFPCVEFAVMRADARRIAKAMNEARNWDVFGEMSGPAGPGLFQAERGFAAVRQAAETHRRAGHQQVADLLAGVEATRFVLSGLAFIARRGWRNSIPSADLPRLSAPAPGFAAASLERLHRRVRKRGKAIADMPASERHALRLSLKALRYTSDFFADLFPATPATRLYLRAVSRLQDVLGTFNDMVTITDQVRRLHVHDDAPAARAVGIMLGWYGRAAVADDAAVLKAWQAFRRAKPFWTDALNAAA